MTRKFKILLALTSAIAVIDIFYVVLNSTLDQRAFHHALEDEGKRMKASYNLLLSRQQDNMLTIATFVANDPAIIALFRDAKLAVAREGGGKGGPDAAAARQALFDKVSPAWAKVQQDFDARQLHFHLGPGSNSFLRVHRPEKFGDNMDDVRFTIVDTNKDRSPKAGFETGRVYSGIRGVVPVTWNNPETGEAEHIGALEVGTSFSSVLNLLDNKYDVGAGAFLTAKHVESVMWQDAINRRMTGGPEACGCYLEAYSRPNIRQIMANKGDGYRFRDDGQNLIDIGDDHFAVTHFPLFDYRGIRDKSTNPVGAVVFWRNINSQVAELNESFWLNVIYGLLGFLIIECLIWIAINHITRELQTEIDDQTASLRHRNEELRLAATVFETAREGIIITDTDASILETNKAVSAISGYERQELIGQNPRIFSSGLQDKAFYQNMWQTLAQVGHWEGEVWNRRKDGHFYAESLRIASVRDCDGNVVNHVAIFSDITIQKEHQKELERVAFYDALTGLPNRVLLGDRLKQAIAGTKRNHGVAACLYLDLDGFKAVNDAHGHDIGDKLLIDVSRRMQDVLRENDSLARLGGDEFVGIIVDLARPEDCDPLLNRLLDAASAPVEIGDISLQVSASIGVTFFRQSATVDADLLLRQADQAMYQSKLRGKNSYTIFDETSDRHLRDYHDRLATLRHALKNQEFCLYYQPKVDLEQGKMVSMEALIRWQHPEQGLLLPGTFLPDAQSTDLVVGIGEWVIETALQQMDSWLQQGRRIPVSINLDVRHLQQTSLPDRLASILARYPDVRPSDLDIEILETSSLEDNMGVINIIKRCKKLGVTFSIDDFGTGFASLSYLRQFPVDHVKIDRSFIRNILDDPEDLAIVEGILGLAAAFNRAVIAEGVETPAHEAMLSKLGCHQVQGFSIAHPMPVADIPDWLDNWTPGGS